MGFDSYISIDLAECDVLYIEEMCDEVGNENENIVDGGADGYELELNQCQIFWKHFVSLSK